MLGKQDIESFFKVLDVLDKEGTTFGRTYNFSLCAFKYIDIGEGMEWQKAEQYDLDELKKELFSRICTKC